MNEQKTSHTTQLEAQRIPERLIYDSDSVQASLGDFIGEVTSWLYHKAKDKYSRKPGSQKPVILCIDNEPMIHVGLGEYINKHGCIPVRAINSREAWNAVDSTLPNLIFLDIHMPDDDTLALLQSFKSNPKTKDIPVIIVTGVNDKRLISTYLDAGADDYFLKSYHPDQLQKPFKPCAQAASPQAESASETDSQQRSADDDTRNRDITNTLILLEGSEAKLIHSLDNPELSDSLRHDLNNALFGIQTAKKIVTDKF